MGDEELHSFYESLVCNLRGRGVVCAITSGLACVHYGVSETTQDCDLLCHPASFQTLLNTLAETDIAGHPCHYRGNISPPLDARWHRGGWTSHFQWDSQPVVTTLDVFGHALRESTPWPLDVFGLYAGPHTVAQMKRTNRDKDWAAITALGVRMIEAEDDRGWLHVFDPDTLRDLLEEYRCPPEIASLRPAIGFAVKADLLTAGAIQAERRLWEELDRSRIRMFERHLRPYVAAIRQARAETDLSLEQDHERRVACALQHLPQSPLEAYGLQRYLDEARRALVASGLVPANALEWLPDVTTYFKWLTP